MGWPPAGRAPYLDKGAGNRGLALSNPKFEYWLLLHFEDGHRVTSPQDCDKRLREHLPNTGKKIPRGTFSREQIEEAVIRAKKRDHPPCDDWPREPGRTTMYRLVEKILESPPPG